MFRTAGRLGSSTWILGGQTCVAKHVYVVFYFRKIWLDLKLFYVQPIAAGTIHLDELMVQNGRRFVLEINLNLRAATSRKVLPDMCAYRRVRSACAFAQADRNLLWAHLGQPRMQTFLWTTKTDQNAQFHCLQLAHKLSEGTFSAVAALLSHRMSIKPSFIIYLLLYFS